tara:strand:- start:2204 stop:4318 length:2115 start_codon:yes stop_codon:yes gene_type:complete
MPERDYGLGGQEARDAYDSAKAYAESQAAAGRDDSPNIRPRARPEKDDNKQPSTVTYYDDDKGESNTISVSDENRTVPLKDSKGNTIANIDLVDRKVIDLYSTDEGLYEGLDISFIDKVDAVPFGSRLTYENTPSGKKGFTFKIGKGKAYLDADKDFLKKDSPVVANTGFTLDFAEGGSVPDTNPMQMEMDLILSETKDPVSGNTAPLGATPEEVRDDIPINASPNEFMINAATRRYFGTEFFEELQKSAAEGWERIKKGEESYFRDDELEVEDEKKGQDKPINMQEGGVVPEREVPKPVGGGFGGYGGTGSLFTGFEPRVFINDSTGQRVTIFFFNGRPLSRIPSGFREKEADVVEEQKIVESARKDRREEEIEIENSFKTKNVDKWEPLDYQDHYDELNSSLDNKRNPLKLSFVEKGILSLVGSIIAGPAGALGLVKLAEKQKRDRAQTIFEKTANIMDADTRASEIKFDDPYYATVADTNYILGSALGVSGYDPVVANPFKDSELDEGGFPTQEARDKRNLKIFDLKNVPVQEAVRDTETGEIVRIGDVDEYYAAGGFRPRSRPPSATRIDKDTGQILPNIRITSTSRSATPEAIAKYAGKEEKIKGTKLTEMLGGLRKDEERSRADVEIENLARAAGVSVDRYKDMSPYEISESYGSSASGDRIDRLREQQRIRDIISGTLKPRDVDEEREFEEIKKAVT